MVPDDDVARAEYQRSCKAFDSSLEQLTAVQVELPGVLAALRAAEPQLDVTCIAPERELPAVEEA